jgi:hypothetical protein
MNFKDESNKQPEDTIYSAIPMLQETIDDIKKPKEYDSYCTRFARKKFVCIVIFCLLTITLLNFFTTVTEKMSDDQVSRMYSLLGKTLNKIYSTPILYNQTNNETEIE